MEDQTHALQQRGIASCFLNSAQRDASVWTAAENGEYLVIFLSPERLVSWTRSLRHLVDTRGVTAFAIDECHCISSWGHDFRQAYRQVGILRDLFPHVPLMALTATATPTVQNDIMQNLRLSRPLIVKTSFDRPNLFYRVDIKRSDLVDLSRRAVGEGSCIVYCLRVDDTEKVALHLRKLGIAAASYHARLSQLQRKKVHRDFLNDALQVVAATIAFGMGIDKPNIRTVIHYGASKSLEQYYQETGRAGRDGLPSKCVLLYSTRDFQTHAFLQQRGTMGGEQARENQERALATMKAFVSSTKCRRQLLMRHFGEEWKDGSNCALCDNCCRSTETTDHIKRDFSMEARAFALALSESGERFGFGVPIALLRGSKRKDVVQREKMFRVPLDEMKSFGLLKNRSESWLKAFAQMLLNRHVVEEYSRASFRLVRLSPTGRRLLRGDPTLDLGVWEPSKQLLSCEPAIRTARRPQLQPLRVRRQQQQEGDDENEEFMDGLRRGSVTPYSFVMSGREHRLLGVLKRVRRQAIDPFDDIAPHMVADDTVLIRLAKTRPDSRAALLDVDGVTERMADQYGNLFLQAIKDFDGGDSKAELRLNEASAVSNIDVPWKQTLVAPTTFAPVQEAEEKRPRRLPPVFDNRPQKRFVRHRFDESPSPSPPLSPALEPPPKAPPASKKRHRAPKVSKQMLSMYEELRQGVSVSELSQRRGVRRSKIEAALPILIMNGYDIDLSRFGISVDTEKKALNALQTANVDIESNTSAVVALLCRELKDTLTPLQVTLLSSKYLASTALS